MIDLPNRNSVALFLDVDGTLLDFAARPEAVEVPSSLVSDLGRARNALGGAVAFVSGRTIRDLDHLFEPLCLAAAGVHGAEFRLQPDAPIVSISRDRLPEQLWRDLTATLAGFPGILVEHKTFAFAVHYRAAPQFAGALATALEAVVMEAGDPSLSILHGHCVIEIKRRAHGKGAAIDLLMRQSEFAARKPIFIGDDATDLPGFAAALRHRGFAYSVGNSIAGLSGTFENPQDVRVWLGRLANQNESSA
jgi:trehalose 6-phosphate phosphatase